MRLGVTAGVAGLLVVLVGTAGGPAAASDYVVLKKSGVWTAFQTKTARGQPICGLQYTFPDRREFYIKWFDGKDRLALQAFKPTWEVPPGTSTPVILTFGAAHIYGYTTFATDTKSDFVEFYVLKEGVRKFTEDLTTASKASLEFTAGSEPPWALDLAGVSGALDAMVRCIDTVAGPTATDTPYAYLHAPVVATQPFGGAPSPASGPTQPFGGAPSQPFGGVPPQPPVEPPATQPFGPQPGGSGGPKTPQ